MKFLLFFCLLSIKKKWDSYGSKFKRHKEVTNEIFSSYFCSPVTHYYKQYQKFLMFPSRDISCIFEQICTYIYFSTFFLHFVSLHPILHFDKPSRSAHTEILILFFSKFHSIPSHGWIIMYVTSFLSTTFRLFPVLCNYKQCYNSHVHLLLPLNIRITVQWEVELLGQII